MSSIAAFIAPVVALVLVGCQSAAVNTSRDRYLATWEARLEQYRNQFVEKDKELRAKSSQPVFFGIANDKNTWVSLVSRVSELSLEIREAFTIAGHGEALKAFIAHMQTDPSPGLTDVWFAQQAQDLTGEAKQLDSRGQDFVRTFDQRVRKDAEWILDMESLARAQGMLLGRAAELQSLHNQALSYFLDLRQARAEDQYRAQQQQARTIQALAFATSYLNQLNYQRQLLTTLNHPRTCTVGLNVITCY